MACVWGGKSKRRYVEVAGKEGVKKMGKRLSVEKWRKEWGRRLWNGRERGSKRNREEMGKERIHEIKDGEKKGKRSERKRKKKEGWGKGR